MSRTLRICLAVVAALALAACGDLFNPLETDEGDAGIDLRVTACTYDTTTTLATATFELTSKEKEYNTILVNGELSDASGVVIATTSTSVVGVQPGKTYREDMVFGLTSEPEGEISCDVSFEFASAGFGN